MRKGFDGRVVPSIMLGALLIWGAPQAAVAGVDVGVNINIGPPPIIAAEPPEVVLVPRTQVYFVPGLEFDVFFHNGFWWSLRGDRWYRARAYNGPWGIVERRLVPAPIIGVPRDYRTVYGRERHIPYGQWKKEWARHHGRDHRDLRERRHGREEFRERGERHEHRESGRGGEREHGRER